MDRPRGGAGYRLCNGVLQNRMLLDHWLSGFVRGKLQPSCAISCGWPPISSVSWTGIPPSAAVNEAVEQTRRLANQQAARLVNGVLRNLLRAMPLPLPDDLSLRYSHPEPIVRLFLAQFGRRRRSAFCKPTTKRRRPCCRSIRCAAMPLRCRRSCPVRSRIRGCRLPDGLRPCGADGCLP